MAVPANATVARQRTLRRRLDVLRTQWRTATAAGDHHHTSAIEATARQVLAELDQPEPTLPAEPAISHGWWLVSNTPVHPGCAACHRIPGDSGHR